MILLFTPEEREWLDTEEFNWHVKEGAPEDIRKSIEKKLKVSEGDGNETAKTIEKLMKEYEKENS